MSETARQMVVRLTMDAGNFTRTAQEINRQIKAIDSEIKNMGDSKGAKTKLEEKLELQKQAVENLKKALESAKSRFNEADTEAKRLMEAKKVAGLESQLIAAEGKAAALNRQLSAANYIRYGSMIKNFGSAMRRMGQYFSMYIGMPLAALGISSFNAFKDYEMALARLQSALPGAEEEVSRLNEAALKMSETIPVSYEEIMAIMTALAKAGVPTEEIDGMTLALARMSAVTGMTAGELSTDMVMFMNSMGLPMGNIDQLGAALVRLADESIATEEGIFSMATRMAATANLTGFSATEVLSLAAAFASMGVEAEAGGSAASKLMKKMQLAAETGDGLEGFAQVMGITGEEFMSGWKQSPADSMLAFFQGLADLDASGEQSVTAWLEEMELNEIRLSNLIALGASNPDMFEGLMGSGKEGFAENTALVEKAGIIFETTSGQMDMLANSTRNAQADLGENVADAFGPLIEKVGEMVKKFGELDETTQTRWVNVTAGIIGAAGVATMFGRVVEGVGGLVGWIGKIKSGEATMATKLLGALAGPAGGWLLAGLGLAGVVAALNSIESPSEKIINNLKNIEIGLDEDSYNATMKAIAEVKAQTDALAGEQGEYNKNVSLAVKAGYGTADMFGTALGYEALLTQNQIGEIAGEYAGRIDELNAAIGAETDKGAQAVLAQQRDALQAEWNAQTQAAKASYMASVSALVAGMMQSQPEAKAALEQAAQDYDVLAAMENVISQVMATDDQAAIDALWASFFTPTVMDKYFEGQRFEDIIPATAVDLLRQELTTSLKTSLEKAGGDESLAYTLLQSILTDPLAAGLYDATLTQGALDGLVELLDFKRAGEEAGKNYSEALTPGLADGIDEAAVPAGEAMDRLQADLVARAASMGKAMGDAATAAWKSNLGFGMPGMPGAAGSSSVFFNADNVNINNGSDAYNLARIIARQNQRLLRGYGKG